MRATKAAGIEAVLSAGAGVLPPEVGVAAFRIVQEALTNVVKHARASRVEVRHARARRDRGR